MQSKRNLLYLNLILILFFFTCKHSNLEEQISKLIFEENQIQRIEILYEKEIQFSNLPLPQKVYILRNINQEILVLIYFENGLPKLYKKIIFTSPLYGKYEYDSKSKTWLAKNYSNPKEFCIIQKIEFFQLMNDPFYSIFLEILTEEPPLPLASVPLVLREGEIIFSGMEELSQKNFLQENRYSTFHFNEKEQKLEILTNPNKLVLTYIYKNKRFSLVLK